MKWISKSRWELLEDKWKIYGVIQLPTYVFVDMEAGISGSYFNWNDVYVEILNVVE